MQLLPQEKPSPRLLNTVVPDLSATATPEPPRTRSALLKGALLSGNGLAIFSGLLLGCFVIAGAGWLHARHTRAQDDRPAAPIEPPAATPEMAASPSQTVVEIRADDIRVTAISLDQPRLAVINAQQLGEGDFLNVRTPSAQYQVKLRVVKIADGAVELNDGAQSIVARLAVARRAEDKPSR
jgi:hypothetical protein